MKISFFSDFTDWYYNNLLENHVLVIISELGKTICSLLTSWWNQCRCWSYMFTWQWILKKKNLYLNYYRKNNNNLRDWDVLTFCIATKLRHEKNSNTRISPMAFRLVNLNIRQPVIYDQSNIKNYIFFFMFHDKARTRPPFVCHFIKIIHHIMHTLVGCRQRFLKKNCHLKEQTNL